jgi:tRNA-uridine 2-sulfurtransferase
LTSGKNHQIAVAMSGGVDSTAAAVLLADSGRRAMGVTMKLWDCALHADIAAGSGACCSPRDAADASRAAAQLGLEHILLDMSEVFVEQVVKPFCSEYAAGRTPSPCVRCNRSIKFGALFDRLRPAGCSLIATGHYARLSKDSDSGEIHLLRGASRERDQSYFLSALTPEQLARTLFPVGDVASKDELRRLLADRGLKIAEKPSSQEFCFAPDGNYQRVLARFAPVALEPGPLLDSSGRKLGDHAGIGRYTIGQRRGLGVAVGEPLYVVKIEPASRTVIVGSDPELYAQGLLADELNWIAAPPQGEMRCTVRVRHGGSETPCSVRLMEGARAEVSFDEPIRAIAPGQQAVFYDAERVLGGGTIVKAL